MFSLVADYGDSAESSSSDTSEDSAVKLEAQHNSLTNPPCDDTTMLQSGTSRIMPGSVFSNPFREAEEAKLASLEKHVKMVDPEANTPEQKRKVCWSYKKGRCRFGSKCNFAHDSDLILRKELAAGSSENEQYPPSIDDTTLNASKTLPPNKKKRPGLSRELVPPKKVLKMYHREKYGMLK
uniref:Uncharacterized protein n=1 Tax=Anopheles atroparvus TaxID=41427 RepID=A0A182J5X8_ANOAO